MNFYAGVGSRETPPAVLEQMTYTAGVLEGYGFTLRSGGAKGADSAFEKGAIKKRVYLPWNGFNGKTRSETNLVVGDSEWLRREAAIAHPRWSSLSSGAKLLMGRNTAQVLGHWPEEVDSKFVVCWTPGGLGGGGTGQAIRIAKRYNIPVFDLAHPEALGELNRYLRDMGIPRF